MKLKVEFNVDNAAYQTPDGPLCGFRIGETLRKVAWERVQRLWGEHMLRAHKIRCMLCTGRRLRQVAGGWVGGRGEVPRRARPPGAAPARVEEIGEGARRRQQPGRRGRVAILVAVGPRAAAGARLAPRNFVKTMPIKSGLACR